MCISNHSIARTDADNDSTNKLQNAQDLNDDEVNTSRYVHTEALENTRKNQIVNVSKLYETELKQHLINIESKLDVLSEV